MKRRRARWWIIAGASALAGLVAWQRGWFATEPVYRGRTVTQWLDQMALFEEERNRDITFERDFRPSPSPQIVTNDLALKALLKIGSDAVPVLEQRLIDPPEWPQTFGLWDRVTTWARWKWKQMRSSGLPPPRPAPMYHNSVQRARAMAAGLALLALGTNANGGVVCLLETYIDSPTNGPQSTFYEPFLVARSGLPERRAEIVASITTCLDHTNQLVRSLAANAAQLFWHDSPSWKGVLLKMTEEKDEEVRLASVRVLATAERGDPETMRMLESAFTNAANPERLRGYAAAGLGLAGVKATNYLALLQMEANHTNSSFQRQVRRAIENIEKAIPR